MIPSEFRGPFLGSNVVSAALLISADKWPRLTRVFFVLIYLAAGTVNTYVALTIPETYRNYGELAIVELYRSFINRFFTKHIQAIVLAIALGQLGVGALLSGSGYLLRIGVVGAIVFLVAASPLGVGYALPARLLKTAALILIPRRLFRDGSHLGISHH